MNAHESLFAEKLRAFRASNGAHGRMTQEELAQLLDVSVDAIGKYERSLSFIRGDLEHRLAERLGWPREVILACREDWACRVQSGAAGLRVFREFEHQLFFDSAEEMNAAILALEQEGTDDFPEGFSVGDPVWNELCHHGTLVSVSVMNGGELVAHTAIVFLNEALERDFRGQRLLEIDFSPDTLRRPVLPGNYFAYCAGVYIGRGHQAAALPLFKGFLGILEELADREVFLRDLGAIAASPVGRQLCGDLGFRCLGQHRDHSQLGFWLLPGVAVPGSLFGRRSPKLRQAYELHFGVSA